ncbi:MAG: hypothetical protein PW843_26740 [Azospirillaceae bacterium]|nr:hypothetical protein [Azospirillaceae bacterium]
MPKAVIVVRALLMLALSGTLPAAAASWNSQDVNDIVSTALAPAGTGATGTMEVMALADLARTLLKAGNPGKAREVANAAALLLQNPATQPEAYTRESLIETLVLAGDPTAGRAVAMVDAPPPAATMAQARLATALAHAGDKAAALQVAKGITIPTLAPTAYLGLTLDMAHALPRIAKALAETGAADDALRLQAKPQPDLSRVEILANVAVALCDATPMRQRNTALGRKVATQAVETTRTALNTADPSIRFDLIEATAGAAAHCIGAKAARNFVAATAISKIQENAVLGVLVRGLATDNKPLAHALVPTPDPADIGELLDASDLLVKLDDHIGALALIKQAFSLASLAQSPGPGPAILRSADRFSLFSRLSGRMASLGEYDDALSVIQTIELENRLQFYVSITRSAIDRQDAPGVARMTAVAIDALKADMDGPDGALGHLYALTRELVMAGYQTEAKTALAELQAVPQTPTRRLDPYKTIVLQADMGDVAGAVAAANAQGPMTAPPSPMAALAVTTMMFDNAKTPPTQDEVAKALATAQKMMPAAVAGAHADTLVGIARDLALKGDTAQALEVESGLEGESNANIVAKRNSLLADIAKAQIKAADLHDALATSLRITDQRTRWQPLLSLAAFPVGR